MDGIVFSPTAVALIVRKLASLHIEYLKTDFRLNVPPEPQTFHITL